MAKNENAARGSMSRNKGKSGEREVAKLLTSELGDLLEENIKRNLLEQTRDGGCDLTGLPGFAIEVKRYQSVSGGQLAVWWRQSLEQAALANGIPVLFFRGDRREWAALVPLAWVQSPWSEPKGMYVGFDRVTRLTIPTFCSIVRGKLSNHPTPYMN